MRTVFSTHNHEHANLNIHTTGNHIFSVLLYNLTLSLSFKSTVHCYLICVLGHKLYSFVSTITIQAFTMKRSCCCADTKWAPHDSRDMDRGACLLTDRSAQTKQIRQPNKWLTYGANRPYGARLSRHMQRYLTERERGSERNTRGVNDRMSEKSKEGMRQSWWQSEGWGGDVSE